jgi:hypothetical protein
VSWGRKGFVLGSRDTRCGVVEVVMGWGGCEERGHEGLQQQRHRSLEVIGDRMKEDMGIG